LDEGILAASVATLRGAHPAGPWEAIVVVPAFDMYASCADAAGGRVVEVRQGEDFEFPLEEVLAAITPRTRLVFVTDPNNPTGISVPRTHVLAIAEAARGAIVFLDEAYADFRGVSLIGSDAINRFPNIVVGRTFAKAHGLAAMRIGALVGDRSTLEPIRRVVPPYSINVAAAVALPAALRDTGHFTTYLSEARRSKDLLYAALDRLEVPYWRSDANFVLARFGARAAQVLAGLQSRGIYVRDRSSDHGCRGAIRITAGVVAHTERAIEAIEEVLCGGR
jgi:histidinol-phosphate aminotransferase